MIKINLVDNFPYETKLRSGDYKVPVTLTLKGKRVFFKFGFNKKLMEEVKLMEGAKWHGYDETNPVKQWSVANSFRNHFQISFLEGKNPYAPYDRELISWESKGRLVGDKIIYPYAHQQEFTRHILTRHYCHGSCEMGTGKTLACIEAMEESGFKDWWWLGPKSALYAVEVEFSKWSAKFLPKFVTYDGLKRIIVEWVSGRKPPKGVIFDESHKLKNITSQRSQAAFHLANAIREEWGPEGFVVLMSGSPAPKSPPDWWSQCEIACPGFLKEGTVEKFKNSIGIIVSKENMITGGVYPHLVTWLDDEKKCKTCGQLEDNPDHDIASQLEEGFHMFTPSVNEVGRLYKRMKGLTLVKFKKDCTDLPEKQYRVIRCKPSIDTLRAAKLLTAMKKHAATTLTLLRELSDGFQYEDVACGEATCTLCGGTRTRILPKYIGPEINEKLINQLGLNEEVAKYEGDYTDLENVIIDPSRFPDLYKMEEQACPLCDGIGTIVKTAKEAKEVPCPKEDALKELLDEHDDVGRIVIYAGFSGSIDRIVKICTAEKWYVIKADGRGWVSDLPGKPTQLINHFQNGQEAFPRVAFIGHPGAAGTGLTLTASPSIVYYSNDFNADSRIQSEDRIHRPGMDHARGATIIDIFHLPTDEYVYANLMKKRKLQDLSLGEFSSLLDVRVT